MRALAALGVAVALLLGGAAPARAIGERAALIADHLREDPLYVSPDLARVATPARMREIRAAMARWRQPVYVVWTPVFSNEPGADTTGRLFAQIRDQLDRPGAYVLSDPEGFVDLEVRGVRLPIKALGAGNDTFDDVPTWKPPSDRIVYLLNYARTGERPTRGEGEAYLDRDDAAAALGWKVFGGTAVLVAALIVLREARRRRRRPISVTRAELTAETASAEQALERLGRRVAAADAPPPHALDLLEAGRSALARGGRLDVVGAGVLARLGDAALGGDAPRPCFYDPRHPWGQERVRYASGRQDAELPACRRCAADVRAGRAPDALTDDGRPYWSRDTVWSRTGFGALDEDVAARILAGER